MRAALPAGIATAALGSERRVVGLVAAAHFFSHLYILVLAPIFPVLQGELAVTALQLGLLVAAMNATTLLAQTPTGFLVDRLGAGRILIVGHTLMAAAVAAMALAPGYAALVALAVAAGLGNAVYHPADYAILGGRVAKERLGRAFAAHTFGGYLGFAAAPLTIVPLTQAFGWRVALATAGVAGLVVALLLVLDRAALATADRGRAVPGAARADVALLTGGPVLLALLFFVLLSLMHTGLGSFGPATLHALGGLSLVEANLPVTVYFIVSTVGVLIGGRLADRTARHRLVVAACAGVSATVGALAAGLPPALPALVALFAVAGLAGGVIAPSRDLLVRAVAPPGTDGKVFGFVMTGFNIGSLIAPPLFGWLLDRGEPRLVLAAVAVFGAAIVVTVLGAGRRPGYSSSSTSQ
jgi:MFS family permease